MPKFPSASGPIPAFASFPMIVARSTSPLLTRKCMPRLEENARSTICFAMRGCRKQQLSVDEDAWVSLVTKELGEKGKTEFDSMLTGATQLPDSDAFGPCFTRTTRMLRRYQLGFPE